MRRHSNKYSSREAGWSYWWKGKTSWFRWRSEAANLSTRCSLKQLRIVSRAVPSVATSCFCWREHFDCLWPEIESFLWSDKLSRWSLLCNQAWKLLRLASYPRLDSISRHHSTAGRRPWSPPRHNIQEKYLRLTHITQSGLLSTRCLQLLQLSSASHRWTLFAGLMSKSWHLSSSGPRKLIPTTPSNTPDRRMSSKHTHYRTTRSRLWAVWHSVWWLLW